MKSKSGSPLQKATFIVLLLVLGCLAYLVMREYSRGQQPATEAREAATTAAQPNQPNSTEAPVTSVTKPAYAPLRPRLETNVVRIVTNRVPVVLRTNFPVMTAAETGLIPVGGGAFGQASPAVPVAYVTAVAPGTPGSAVFGRATLRGVPPAETSIPLDTACGRLNPSPITTRHYVVGTEGGLANVFVYIKTGAPKAGRQESVPVLDNVRCEFQPYVLGVRAGQPFSLRNSDPMLHNFHLMPRSGGGNRESNVAAPVQNMSVAKVFEKPEVFVKVKCDVHPWMFAYIGVVEHPWFAVTDQNGNFTLPLGLPVGQYTLAAVHLRAGELTQPLSVGDANTQPVSFDFEVPKPLARTP